MNDYMEIVIGPDENYAMPCGVLITSILYTNPGRKIRFHIISEYLSEKTKKLLMECVKGTESVVVFYRLDPDLMVGFPPLHNSLATYAILFIANILPAEIEKVLYLDADMIVMDSLEYLWNTDITDYPMAGAISPSHDDIRNYNRLDYDCEKGYYNIGTHVINLAYWRKNNLLEECFNIIKNNSSKLKQRDQDVLNILLAGNWKIIHSKYNCYINYYFPIENILIRKKFHDEIKSARLNPVILHFINVPKPWHKEYDMPLVKVWMFFKKMSPWKNKKLKYYYHGTKVLKSILKHILTSLHLYTPKWDIDPDLNMPAIIERIFVQIDKAKNTG